MGVDEFLRLLQFSDGLFPAGGYAHSFGLETWVQSGRVKNAEDVAAFLGVYLESSAAPSDAVVAICSRTRTIARDLRGWLQLDQMLDALRTASELRQASRQMGRQTLRVLKELSANTFIQRLAAEMESGGAACHHPVVFGSAAAVFGWPLQETASALLYSTSAMIVGAALRLLPLGQLAGQRILWGAGTLIASLSELAHSKLEDIWSFTPELEIAQMGHESLEARLFRS